MYNKKRRWRRINKMVGITSARNRFYSNSMRNVFWLPIPEWKYDGDNWFNRFNSDYFYKIKGGKLK